MEHPRDDTYLGCAAKNRQITVVASSAVHGWSRCSSTARPPGHRATDVVTTPVARTDGAAQWSIDRQVAFSTGMAGPSMRVSAEIRATIWVMKPTSSTPVRACTSQP